VPLPLLVVPPSVPVPDCFEMTTVPPLETRLLPFESFRRTVIVDLLDPLAVIVVGEAVIVDVAVEAFPAIETIVAEVPVDAPSVAVTVQDPTAAGVVNVTLATPLPFVDDVLDENEPPPQLFDQVAVWPEAETELPFTSASCAVIVTLLPATGVNEVAVTRNFAAAPAANVTSAVCVNAPPFSVPVMCAVTAESADVSVAV
jgi:hypothetical protein